MSASTNPNENQASDMPMMSAGGGGGDDVQERYSGQDPGKTQDTGTYVSGNFKIEFNNSKVQFKWNNNTIGGPRDYTYDIEELISDPGQPAKYIRIYNYTKPTQSEINSSGMNGAEGLNGAAWQEDIFELEWPQSQDVSGVRHHIGQVGTTMFFPINGSVGKEYSMSLA